MGHAGATRTPRPAQFIHETRFVAVAGCTTRYVAVHALQVDARLQVNRHA